jgi:uracil-DNA glycosylase family 4
MDARERLRRYLEQRRELGETEFVLDALSVDEALALLAGGKHIGPAREGTAAVTGRDRSAAGGGAATFPPDTPSAPLPDPPPPPPIAPRMPAADSVVGGDWRSALQATGVSRGAVDPQPVAGAPVVGSESVEGLPEAAPWPAWLTALGLPAGIVRAAPPLPDAVTALDSLEAVGHAAAACVGCALHRSARNPVPGAGHPRADLLCIGEAPGADEDATGLPFVGEAGQLLTNILAAIKLSRDDVYIANVLKHRPPGNRDPLPDEMQACLPLLWRQVALVRPRVILALGRVAAQALTGSTQGIGALRGRVHGVMGIPLVATYHPAALLRNEAWKRPTWADVRLAQQILLAARAHDGRGDVAAPGGA